MTLKRLLYDTLVIQQLSRHVPDLSELNAASIMLTVTAQEYFRVEGAVHVKSGFDEGTWQRDSRSCDSNLGQSGSFYTADVL